MILNIFQLILTLVIFIGVKYGAYKVIDDMKIPVFMEYMPYTCYTCLNFWLQTGIYLSLGLICGMYVTMGVGMVLNILDTIAQKVHQKNNTVSAYDFENSEI